VKKNVLIIHTDQQRYDSMGCTGNATAETPNLDALAAEGVLFSRHIASNTICMPSRASLMTGLYPPAHGVWDNGVPLGRREYVDFNPTRHGDDVVRQPATIGDVFTAAGYETALFGKLHLTPFLAPTSHGFQESSALWDERGAELEAWDGPYYGFGHVELTCGHGPLPTGHFRRWIEREHPDVVETIRRSAERKPIREIGDLYVADMPLALHPTSWLADRFTSWLAARHGGDRPFCAFVGFPDPHHPFVPTREAADRFEGRPVAGPHDPEGTHWRDYVSGKMASGATPSISQADRELVLRHTNAMIWQIDLAIGRIMEALRTTGALDETIVVFTADHGDFMWDHGLLRKGVGASSQLLRVPLIIRAPGLRPGTIRPEPTSNTDILPTLAALCDVELPDHECGPLHGRPLFEGAASRQSPRATDGASGAARSDAPAGGDGAPPGAFAYCSIGTAESTNFTVYDERYRYTVFPHTGRRELVDHEADPWEAVNLLRDTPQRDSGRAATRLQGEIDRALPRHYLPTGARVAAW
jgi:arylsulfatase A-like enzyme